MKEGSSKQGAGNRKFYFFLPPVACHLHTSFLALCSLLLALSSSYSCIQKEKTTPTGEVQYEGVEAILIPENYRGKVHIIYDEPCGNMPGSESGKKLFEIPENGIYITHALFGPAVLKQRYYLVDANGNRKALPVLLSSDFDTIPGALPKYAPDEVAVFDAGMSGNHTFRNEQMFFFIQFYVGSYEQLRDSFLSERYNEQFSKLEHEQLAICRGELPVNAEKP